MPGPASKESHSQRQNIRLWRTGSALRGLAPPASWRTRTSWSLERRLLRPRRPSQQQAPGRRPPRIQCSWLPLGPPPLQRRSFQRLHRHLWQPQVLLQSLSSRAWKSCQQPPSRLPQLSPLPQQPAPRLLQPQQILPPKSRSPQHTGPLTPPAPPAPPDPLAFAAWMARCRVFEQDIWAAQPMAGRRCQREGTTASWKVVPAPSRASKADPRKSFQACTSGSAALLTTS
mmetsp:Transcript_47821/g.89509  ORF Transcript_47821/g.89509 Transcript_47821/m.89509 type:complete len:229 (+) Transcript_47821:396-1082(+)